MEKKRITSKVFILIFAPVLFYALVISFSDFNSLMKGINDFDFQYLPIILSLMGVHTIILSLKFHRLAQKLDINLPFKESIKIFIAGLSLNITPGGIGAAIKCQILKIKYGKSISSTLPIIVVERVTELLGILLVTSVLLIWADLYESKIVLVVGYVLIIILFILLSNSKIFLIAKRIITKIKVINKFSQNLDESRTSLNKLLTKKIVVEATIWSIISKLAHLVTVYYIFLSFGVDLGFFLSGLIYYTSLIFGVVTFIPAGLVVTESSMLGLLLKHNVEFSISVLVVIFTRIVTLWLTTFLGLFTLNFVFKK